MEPISRTKLQTLHSEELARQRNENIDRIVKYIYQAVRNKAIYTASDTQYIFLYSDCPILNNTINAQDVSKDIISRIEELFPDCKIETTKVVKAIINKKFTYVPATSDQLQKEAIDAILVDWS